MSQSNGTIRPVEHHFDFGAADEAARQLELSAQALLETVAAINQEVPATTEHWRGRFREVFDVETARHVVAARLLADDLVTLAAQVRAHAVLAAAEDAATP